MEHRSWVRGDILWGALVLNEALYRELGLLSGGLQECIAKANEELSRRAALFRQGRDMPSIRGKLCILVDDGLASGYTMLAAVRTVRKEDVTSVVVAVPAASYYSTELVAREADQLYCPNIRRESFYAVADAYVEWRDLTDQDVLTYLRQARHAY